VSLEHTLVERPDVVSFLSEFEPPPMSAELREATAEVARELAGAWSHGALPPGVELGPYTIQGPLGQGGQATVYRAEDAAGQSFAIKVPRQELLARLVREAQILFHLDHPRVVRIVSADVKGTPPYLVTEHLSGGTLADVLEAAPEGRLGVERVRELGLAVLEALAYAHEKGVIHRDLKPSNILFDAAGEAKVADFGIGSLTLVHRLEGTLVSHDRTGVAGTPLYMAPEQEIPSATVDARADLYALGKVFYRALTGRSPRTIRPLRRVLPDLDDAWEDFILRLVEDDPSERFADATKARSALLLLPPPLVLPPMPEGQLLRRLSHDQQLDSATTVQIPFQGDADPGPSEGGVELETNIGDLELETLEGRDISGELARIGELIESIPVGLPAQLPGPPSDPTDRAPWATGYVVDQVLAVAQQLATQGQGSLFAFVPQPWEPGPSLRGVVSAERSFAQLDEVLAIDPLGVAVRGRTIRATFTPRGSKSQREWVETALEEHLHEQVLASEAPPETLFLVKPGASLVAQVGGPRSDAWLSPARAALAGEELGPDWIQTKVGDDHLLLAQLPRANPQQRQRAFERLGYLAQRMALVLAPGDLWRHVSPGPGFDTTQRNLIAQELADSGSLVLHVEPSGRFLVYQSPGVQSTRSVAYLRRLLEGGLGLVSPATKESPRASRTPSARARDIRGIALVLPMIAFLGLLVLSPALNALNFGLGCVACVAVGWATWRLRPPVSRRRIALSLVVMIAALGVLASLFLG